MTKGSIRTGKRILEVAWAWRPSTDPANDPGAHHRPVKGGVALADNFLLDRVMIGGDSLQ
jgi:hypothetical protein